MKRDINLLRAILLQVEQEGNPEEPLIHSLSIEGQEQPLVNEHVKLLIEAGYLDGELKFSTNNRILLTAIRGLTPRAYDFLDNIRNDGLWNKILERISATTGTASLPIIENFAHQVVSSALTRPAATAK